MTPRHSARQTLGAAVLDAPRLLWRLRGRARWPGYANRHDRLHAAPDGSGAYCEGPWSSDLHVCSVFPVLGRLLLQRALHDWPFSFQPRAGEGKPEVTFVVPFRGRERLAALEATVASLLAQEGARVECIVVEQSAERSVTAVPEGVRYLHLPHPSDPLGWRKAWALNVGVATAQAQVVVCHDADLLAPAAYAREALRVTGQGADVAQLGRFLFYLGPGASAGVVASRSLRGVGAPERVNQNWPGGTIVVRRRTFEELGGFDEEFVGWGGEDNEFIDRCLSRRFWRHAHLPFVHLWHPEQPRKDDPAYREETRVRLEHVLHRDRAERIETLRRRRMTTRLAAPVT
jgi:hypothetical protein